MEVEISREIARMRACCYWLREILDDRWERAHAFWLSELLLCELADEIARVRAWAAGQVFP